VSSCVARRSDARDVEPGLGELLEHATSVEEAALARLGRRPELDLRQRQRPRPLEPRHVAELDRAPLDHDVAPDDDPPAVAGPGGRCDEHDRQRAEPTARWHS
jgi:hypothetical protein